MIYFDCSTIYPGIVQEIYFMDIFPDISRTFPGNMSGNIWKRRKHVEKLYMAVSGEPQPKVLTKIIDQYARVLPGNWPVRPEIISDNHAKTKKTWFFFGGVFTMFCYVFAMFCYAFAMLLLCFPCFRRPPYPSSHPGAWDSDSEVFEGTPPLAVAREGPRHLTLELKPHLPTALRRFPCKSMSR